MLQKEQLYINAILLKKPLEKDNYLKRIPAIKQLEKENMSFDAQVTFLIGDNGSGKSTILEAIAIQSGFNPEGGNRNNRFSTRDTHSDLCNILTIQKRNYYNSNRSFFLRAESFYNLLSNYDDLDELPDEYSHHNCSHGEGFMNFINERISSNGLYLMDEPEAALSPKMMMQLLCKIHEAEQNNCQLIIATHSPILISYPGACIYQLNEEGFKKVNYKETDHYIITRQFLENPQKMYDVLFAQNNQQ